MQSYSRQRRHQHGLDLLEGHIYEAQSRILSQPKRSREKTPCLGSQVKSSTLCGEKEAARSKLKKSPTDYQQQKYRELHTKAKILIRESREIYFNSLDSDLARQPKRFWSFLSSRIKRGLSLKR